MIAQLIVSYISSILMKYGFIQTLILELISAQPRPVVHKCKR